MKLVSFFHHDSTHLGVKTDQGILDVTATLARFPEAGIPRHIDEILVDDPSPLVNLRDYVERYAAQGVAVAEADLKFAPAVPRPNKIIGIGLNYYGYLECVGCRNRIFRESSANSPKPSRPIGAM